MSWLNSYGWRDVGKMAALAAGYALLADWAPGTLAMKGSVSIFWPPAGYALAVLLLGGLRYWPVVVTGSILSTWMDGYPFWRQLMVALGNTGEVVLAAWLLGRDRRFNARLVEFRDYLALFVAGTAGAMLGAAVGVAVLLGVGRVTLAEGPLTFLHWYQGDILSVLLVTPLMMTWSQMPKAWFQGLRWVETVCGFGLGALLGHMVFLGQGRPVAGLGPLTLLVVVWGAARYGLHGVLLLMVVTALQATAGAVLGVGPFAAEVRAGDVQGLWGFLLGQTVVGITMALVLQQRERALETARASERRTRLYFERQLVGMAITSPERRFLQVNGRLCEMLGYRREELLEMSWVPLTHAGDLTLNESLFEQLLRGEIQHYQMEKRFLHKQGGTVETNLLVTASRREDGRVEYVLALIEDITERKRAQAALAAAEARYRAFVANSREGIWCYEAEEPVAVDLPVDQQLEQMLRTAYLAECNDALARMYGLEKAEQLVGTRLRKMVQADGRNLELMRRFVQQGYRLADAETEGVDREGQRRYFVNSYVGVVEEGRLVRVWGVQRDETEKRAMERERTRLEEQLRQAQKLESIGRLAGGVAHDFNNLLTIINGFSDLILEGEEAPAGVRERVSQIRVAGERAAGLTQQLLAFSRRQIVQPRLVDLNAELVGMRAMLPRLLGEDVEVVFEPAEGLGLVLIDPGQVHQIVMNLVVNARDAMPHGGRLTVATRQVRLGRAELERHAGLAPGLYVQMEVRDTGHGMDEATLAHIFEPFFTTKRTGEGTGLGLATVYGIVAQNGGLVEVESSPGRGAAFRIALPRAGVEVAPEPARSVREPGQGVGTILLVEDEATVRELVAEILRRRGYQVLQACQGEEALEVAAGYAAPIDLLVTDVIMPGMHGKEVADRLGAVRPGLRVLYLTGYPDDVIVDRGVLAAGIELLTKPVTPSVLAAKVKELLECDSGQGGS